ncbi:MAG: AbgT family transporter [Pseudomonadales bacterium]|nr:AbgT family transporter [Pseudomonadales bacterium]
MTGFFERQLLRIERAGNRIPHPTLLFVYLCAIIAVFSALCGLLGTTATHPVSGSVIAAKSLLTGDGLRYMLTSAVTNFTGFAPVGTVLVAIMGIGVAEHSGLIRAALSATILGAPNRLMTFLVVLVGVLSSLGADTGYVVLIPLAGIVFASAGRNPVAGITAAFAGVSGGFSANLLIGPLDAILAGLSTEAAALVQPGYEVSAAANYYFIVVSTLLVAVVGTVVTEKWVEPMLGAYDGPHEKLGELTPADRRGLRAVGVLTLIITALLLAGLVPENGPLRDPETGSILRSPFISGIVLIIALYGALAGYVFGRFSGSYESPSSNMITGMENSMATMASYLVLMFFAAQFVSWFGWSQLGVITAIKGAEVLKALEPNATVLLVLFVLLSALINLMIGSASAKWALLAPIFVPMLLLSGISPEATQVAYPIGDSSTNIITPLMPYFGVVLAFIQKYDARAGIGTLLAAMLPYSLMFLFCWSVMLALWLMAGIPLGPGANAFL